MYLPWRQTRDPYRILVSEMMLQQTQVDRVIPKYTRFIKTFSTVELLARAPLSQVLLLWSGLGYNRRAKFLHQAAKMLVLEHKGVFPKTVAELEKLPGVGPYTARAVAAFAYNRPVVCIETNIRTVFTHFCFSKKSRRDLDTKISDKELLPLVEQSLPLAKEAGLSPCEWYAALMDYGAFLKKSGVRINSRSRHYAKQSKFDGSARQLRGAILRALLASPATTSHLQKITNRPKSDIDRTLATLVKEGMIVKTNATFSVVR